MDQYARNYRDGFRSGWLDRSLGMRNRYSLVASKARDCQGYSEGYSAGQIAHEFGFPLDAETV